MPTLHGGELDFSKTDYISASYRLNKLAPREGAGTFEVTTAGGQERSFDLISRPFNLARSYLSFTYTMRAAGANTYSRIFMDCLSQISQIQLQTRSGVYLCDINNLRTVTKMLWKPEMSLKDFLDLPNHDTGTGYGCMLQKCNGNGKIAVSSVEATRTAFRGMTDTKDNVAARTLAMFAEPPINVRRHDDTALTDGSGTLSSVNVDYNEAKYLVGSAANGALAINVKIPLGMIINTIFALDKTIMFPEILTMRIVWSATDRTGYTVTNGADTAINTAYLAAVDATVAMAVSADVSNLALFLAVETNPDVIQSIQQKIASPEGMSFNIDYPYVYKNTTPASTTQNIIMRFDRGHGRRLKKIYHSVFNTEERKNTAYDNDNRAAAKVVNFYTTLDGARQQEFNIDCATEEDYMYLKPKIDGSALLNNDVYKYNWFWADAWDNTRPLWSKDQNEISGLSLDTERRWEFIATTANAAFNHYTVAITQREVQVKANMITIS